MLCTQRHVAIFVAIAISGFAAGCGRQAAPEPEVVSEEPIVLTPGNTPEATFTAYQNAVRMQDGHALWNIFSAAARQKRREHFAGMSTQIDQCTPDDRVAMCEKLDCTPSEIRTLSPSNLFARAISAAPPEAFTDDLNATILNTESHETYAILSLKAGEKTRRMRFVEEDGLWKVDD